MNNNEFKRELLNIIKVQIRNLFYYNRNVYILQFINMYDTYLLLNPDYLFATYCFHAHIHLLTFIVG